MVVNSLNTKLENFPQCNIDSKLFDKTFIRIINEYYLNENYQKFIIFHITGY